MTFRESSIPHFYSFSEWQSFPLVAGVVDRIYDFTPGKDDTKKKNLCSALGIDMEKIIFPKQVHGDSIICVDTMEAALYPEGDALITNRKDLPLGIVTADCVPVFVYASDLRAIGLIHAGWRGIAKKIVSKTLEMMAAHYKINFENLSCAIGPCARKCCYQVGNDVARAFSHTAKQQGQIYLDLVKEINSQLLECGISQKNIVDANRCTMCENQTFFSYRKEKNNAGRMLAVMMMK